MVKKIRKIRVWREIPFSLVSRLPTAFRVQRMHSPILRFPEVARFRVNRTVCACIEGRERRARAACKTRSPLLILPRSLGHSLDSCINGIRSGGGGVIGGHASGHRPGRMRKLAAAVFWALTPTVQKTLIVNAPGLMNFVPAVAYHICLNLPAAFTQPGASSHRLKPIPIH